ncbi:hypothetical protein Tco_0113272 [Tanacetum coccineum]
MSSMKNLEDTDNFGDQFLNDKPTEDDQEKSKVVDESDSTIPDPSHQTVTSTPSVIAPVIDFSSPKPSSQVTTPPITTEATSITTTLPEISPFIALQDRNDQRKLMRLNEIHKFSDGTLTRVMEKLDHMVKDFHMFEYNKGMETRKWLEDDKRRSKDFITAIEKTLQIRRIFRGLESFVGERIRDINYRLINKTT